jgi:hypothetical protein
MLPKRKIIISLIAVILILGGISIYKTCYKDHNLLYSQEYIVGSSNIKGNVDTKYFSDIREEFEIGANRYGFAVFKNPDTALARFKTDYKAGIDLVQKEFNLSPLSQTNYEEYKTYGWQVTTGTEAEKEQAKFITLFMDIYENSFNKQ